MILNLRVPSISKEFDVQIPDGMKIEDMIPLLAKAVKDQTEGFYVISDEETICIEEYATPLHGKATLEEYGVLNGDSIYLI